MAIDASIWRKMLLLRPLTTDFSDSSVKFWSPFSKKIERKKKVEHGVPFGQTYGTNLVSQLINHSKGNTNLAYYH